MNIDLRQIGLIILRFNFRMNGCLRYVILDNAPNARGLDCTADELAAALRAPLAAVGVRVVRQHRSLAKSPCLQFQGRGLSRRQYKTKSIEVDAIVDEVMTAYKKAGHNSQRS